METVQLFLLVFLFVGAVRADDNTKIVNENLEIAVIPLNTTNRNSEDQNAVKHDLEVTVDILNNTSQDTELDAKVRAGSLKPENKLLNATNPERPIDKPDEVYSDEGWEFENKTPVDTRRILNGKKVERGARPYMVYLQATEKSMKSKKTKNWMCGGVIVHKEYVITSAACVEDMEKFYVVAGTLKKSKKKDENECVKQNKRKVVWKCVPKSYKFDYLDESNWSANDIAVVKVDRPFKLGKLEEGCQFAAKMVAYNNVSRELEEPGTKGYVLGWGSIGKFSESMFRKSYDDDDENVDASYQCLQEAKVCLMDKEKCAELWPSQLREPIKEFMICTKDIEPQMSKICSTKYANCTVVPTRRELPGNRTVESNVSEAIDPGTLQKSHYYSARRASDVGGFCENDHGGPLVVKYQGEDRVVGVISASKVDSDKKLCHGPFLYTSVYKNRQFLSCSINKKVDDDCRRVFRSGLTHHEWTVDWNDEK